jgi:hypothetical protein
MWNELETSISKTILRVLSERKERNRKNNEKMERQVPVNLWWSRNRLISVMPKVDGVDDDDDDH